jgi:pimeloyl-ACP methyl ester carboxylesterase
VRTHVPEQGWVPVEANGLTHAVFDQGDGPLVVLQHGFPDTAHTWDDVAERLVEQGYRVVRPFGRGIAPSQAPTRDDFALPVLAADLVALIEALGQGPAVLVGHDWGAAAAWGVGHTRPDVLTKLVPVAIPHPAVVKPSLNGVWNIRHFAAHKLPGAARRFAHDDFAQVRTLYERWSPAFDWPDAEFESVKNAYAAPGCLDAALGYYRQLWSWPFKGRVACPTLVVGGLSDPGTTRAQYEASATRVDGPCQVRMLPGGHFLHREHPEPFIDALLEYLAG